MASLEEELETLAEELVINTQHSKGKKRRVSCGRNERLLEAAQNKVHSEAKKLQKACNKGKHTRSKCAKPSTYSRSYCYGPSGRINAKSTGVDRRPKAKASSTCMSSARCFKSTNVADSTLHIPSSQSSGVSKVDPVGSSKVLLACNLYLCPLDTFMTYAHS